MTITIFIGVGLCIVGSSISNLGTNTQKFSHMNEKERIRENPKLIQRSYYKQPIWQIGLFCVFIGSLFDFAALAFAPQSIVATVGSINLVANIIFAHFWLKEPLSITDGYGTCLIMCGAVLAVAFGDHSDSTYTSSQLKHFYTQFEYIVYVLIVGVTSFVCFCILVIATPIKDALLKQQDLLSNVHRMNGDDSETTTVTIDDERELAQLEADYRPFKRIHPVCYCYLAGVFGSQTLIMAKSVAQILRTTVTQQNEFVYPMSYVFIGAMLIAIFIETHYLATALKYFDALFVVPVFQCFFITHGCIAGGLYFREFHQFSALQWIMFPIGVGITLIGVYVLTSRSVSSTDDRGDDDDDDDAAHKELLSPVSTGSPNDDDDDDDDVHRTKASMNLLTGTNVIVVSGPPQQQPPPPQLPPLYRSSSSPPPPRPRKINRSRSQDDIGIGRHGFSESSRRLLLVGSDEYQHTNEDVESVWSDPSVAPSMQPARRTLRQVRGRLFAPSFFFFSAFMDEMVDEDFVEHRSQLERWYHDDDDDDAINGVNRHRRRRSTLTAAASPHIFQRMFQKFPREAITNLLDKLPFLRNDRNNINDDNNDNNNNRSNKRSQTPPPASYGSLDDDDDDDSKLNNV